MCKIFQFEKEYKKKWGIPLITKRQAIPNSPEAHTVFNIMAQQYPALMSDGIFDRTQLLNSVISFGPGVPTEEGYLYAENEYINGANYEDLAYEIIINDGMIFYASGHGERNGGR